MRNPTAATPFTPNWSDPVPVVQPGELLAFLPNQPFLVDALVRRGFSTVAQARPFLFPSLYSPRPPQDLPGLSITADLLLSAVKADKTIAVWGDFDVDGQTSTAILVSALRTLGAKVMYHIPVRERESHGVNIPGLDQLIDAGAQVILTCDTGISAHDAAAHAAKWGIDFLVTDHHSLPPELPAATAVVNPQLLAENHPLRTLSGAGVAYLLAKEMLQQSNRDDEADTLLDLCALGLVADLASLTGDARYLVQLGLERLKTAPRLALETLLEQAGVDRFNLTEEHISFALAPRMNAIGRLSDANPMVEFLLGRDKTDAVVMAARLEGLNAERRRLCDHAFQSALTKLNDNPILLESPVLVLNDPLWHPGVVGIVASRLVDIFHRPVILLVGEEGYLARGSARSVPGIDITAAIREQADLLNSFGGHPMAAGLSLPAEKIGQLRFQLGESVARQVGDRLPEPGLMIDAYLPLSAINLALVESFSLLAPFGPGNPAMTFATRRLILRSTQQIGRTGEHLRMQVEDEQGQSQDVLWWQGVGAPLPEGMFDLAYTLRSSNYLGRREVQAEWLDFRSVEVDIVELQRRTGRIQVEDYRLALDPLTMLSSLENEPDLQLWQEGSTPPVSGTKGRHLLNEQAVLAVLTCPPSRAVLEAAINAAHPKRILLFGLDPGMDDMQRFLTRLAGLIRYCLRERAGWLKISELASATSQTETAVRLGLEWLVAQGSIQLLALEEDRRQVTTGGLLDQSGLQKIGVSLTIVLKESAAFRAFYLRADPQALVTVTSSKRKKPGQ